MRLDGASAAPGWCRAGRGSSRPPRAAGARRAPARPCGRCGARRSRPARPCARSSHASRVPGLGSGRVVLAVPEDGVGARRRRCRRARAGAGAAVRRRRPCRTGRPAARRRPGRCSAATTNSRAKWTPGEVGERQHRVARGTFLAHLLEQPRQVVVPRVRDRGAHRQRHLVRHGVSTAARAARTTRRGGARATPRRGAARGRPVASRRAPCLRDQRRLASSR